MVFCLSVRRSLMDLKHSSWKTKPDGSYSRPLSIKNAIPPKYHKLFKADQQKSFYYKTTIIYALFHPLLRLHHERLIRTVITWLHRTGVTVHKTFYSAACFSISSCTSPQYQCKTIKQSNQLSTTI